MGKNGPEFYDDEEVFATYASRRARIDGPNEILEKPIFDELMGVRQDWIVDDYFETGARVTKWMGGRVIKYHRTTEDYFAAPRSAGFIVDVLRESCPQRERFRDPATCERRKRIPLMLFFSTYRPLTE